MPNLINLCLLKETDADFAGHEGGVFVDFKGLTVEEANALRGEFAEQNVRFKVLKNRIAKRAFEKLELDCSEHLKGPTAYAFGDTEQAIGAAKILEKVLKTNKRIRIKGAVFEAVVLGPEDAIGLAKLPDRPTMQSMLAGTLIAPARGLAASINEVMCGLARCLNEKIEKAGGGDAEA